MRVYSNTRLLPLLLSGIFLISCGKKEDKKLSYFVGARSVFESASSRDRIARTSIKGLLGHWDQFGGDAAIRLAKKLNTSGKSLEELVARNLQTLRSRKEIDIELYSAVLDHLESCVEMEKLSKSVIGYSLSSYQEKYDQLKTEISAKETKVTLLLRSVLGNESDDSPEITVPESPANASAPEKTAQPVQANALPKKSGRLLWEQTLDFEDIDRVAPALTYNNRNRGGMGQMPDPYTSNMDLYIATDDGFLRCYDEKNQLRWKFPIDGKVRGPVVVAGHWPLKCFFGTSWPGKTFYCVDADKGTKVWSLDIGVLDPGPAYCWNSPAIGADGTVYVGFSLGSFWALENFSGKAKWRYNVGVPGTDISYSTAPAIGADGTLYVGIHKRPSRLNGVVSGAVHALNGVNGSCKWQFEAPGRIIESIAIGTDGTVYFACELNVPDKKIRSIIYAVKGATGKKIWEFPLPSLSGSPVIGADGTVYIGSGNLYALNGKTGEKNWQFAPDKSIVRHTPTIGIDGSVYFGVRNKIYAVDEKNGAKRWEFNIEGSPGLSPAIRDDGALYVISKDFEKPAKLLSIKTDIKVPKNAWANVTSTKGAWPMLGQNERRTGLSPDAKTPKVLPPGKQVAWTVGVDQNSIDRFWIGKTHKVIEIQFGIPDGAHGDDWRSYTGMNITNTEGNKYKTVWFGFKGGVVQAVRFDK